MDKTVEVRTSFLAVDPQKASLLSLQIILCLKRLLNKIIVLVGGNLSSANICLLQSPCSYKLNLVDRELILSLPLLAGLS